MWSPKPTNCFSVFTFLIWRVPIPVLGSNTPLVRAFLLKNHWKLVSFLRFVACLKSRLRSRGPQNIWFYKCRDVFLMWSITTVLQDCCRILRASLSVKKSVWVLLSLTLHQSANNHWNEHCSFPDLKMHIWNVTLKEFRLRSCTDVHTLQVRSTSQFSVTFHFKFSTKYGPIKENKYFAVQLHSLKMIHWDAPISCWAPAVLPRRGSHAPDTQFTSHSYCWLCDVLRQQILYSLRNQILKCQWTNQCK